MSLVNNFQNTPTLKDKFDIITEAGKGSYGTVYRAKHR